MHTSPLRHNGPISKYKHIHERASYRPPKEFPLRAMLHADYRATRAHGMQGPCASPCAVHAPCPWRHPCDVHGHVQSPSVRPTSLNRIRSTYLGPCLASNMTLGALRVPGGWRRAASVGATAAAAAVATTTRGLHLQRAAAKYQQFDTGAQQKKSNTSAR